MSEEYELDLDALRAFCERTGIAVPDTAEPAGFWGRKVMRVLNALAMHVEMQQPNAEDVGVLGRWNGQQ